MMHPLSPDVNVIVLRGTRTLSYPKWENAQPGVYVPIAELFTASFPYDAFAMSYVLPSGMQPYRVLKQDFPELQHVLLFADLDAHNLIGSPLETWKDREVARAHDLCRDAVVYRTRGGVRLAWQVDLPFPQYEQYAKAWYSRLEDLGFQGVDHSAASFGRHMRLPNVRRDGREERPTVTGTLQRLHFEAPLYVPKAPIRNRPRAATRGRGDDSTDDPILLMAIARGEAVFSSEGKWMVRCPRENHNGGVLSTATVVLREGRFSCLKASCRDVRYDDWAASIVPDVVSIEEGQRLVVKALSQGGFRQQLSCIDLTTGGGKSHVVREYLKPGALHEGIKVAFLSPTNALATQHRERTGAHQVAGVAADVPDRAVCVQPKAVKALNAAGVSSKYACMSCPNREGCLVADGVGDKDLGEVSTHAMLMRFISK